MGLLPIQMDEDRRAIQRVDGVELQRVVIPA
jgi:hypothetical protein